MADTYVLAVPVSNTQTIQAVKLIDIDFAEQIKELIIVYELGLWNSSTSTFTAVFSDSLRYSGNAFDAAIAAINSAINQQTTTNFYGAIKLLILNEVKTKHGLGAGTVV
jgi:hypothetical protein